MVKPVYKVAGIVTALVLGGAFTYAAVLGAPFVPPQWGPDEEARVQEIIARCPDGMKGKQLPTLTVLDGEGREQSLGIAGKHHLVVEGSFT